MGWIRSEFLNLDPSPQGLDLQHRSVIVISGIEYYDAEILIEWLIYFRDSALRCWDPRGMIDLFQG